MTPSTASEPVSPAASAEALRDRFKQVRRFTEEICGPLATEDYVIQSMPDASPTRWHLAHSTWFFETFVLKPHQPTYRCVDESFEDLFNSYYNSVGQPYPRSRRGLLSRPTVAEIWSYRGAVDELIEEWLASGDLPAQVGPLIELGLQHEQQHQELMLTDLKHMLSCNPLFPVYRNSERPLGVVEDQSNWLDYEEGLVEVGHRGEGFCYDNELPRHPAFVPTFHLQDRLVTNAEYLEFVNDRGYEQPELWLSMGWAAIQEANWCSPLYWHWIDGGWHEFSLAGLHPLDLRQPVTHVSYFEADAFARWAGRRLPTEFEWEHAASRESMDGNLAEAKQFQPGAARQADGLRQCFGDVWEWTSSQYAAYPGYCPLPGALGEYNGKFMCNQFVLRGGSCVTPQSHIRPSYRNFFPPDARWQFTGIRLAQ